MFAIGLGLFMLMIFLARFGASSRFISASSGRRCLAGLAFIVSWGLMAASVYIALWRAMP